MTQKYFIPNNPFITTEIGDAENDTNSEIENESTLCSENVCIEESTAERFLRFFAATQLVVGIIGAVICAVATATCRDGGEYALIGAIILPIHSTIIWALFKVIANMSTTLKEIRYKLSK